MTFFFSQRIQSFIKHILLAKGHGLLSFTDYSLQTL